MIGHNTKQTIIRKYGAVLLECINFMPNNVEILYALLGILTVLLEYIDRNGTTFHKCIKSILHAYFIFCCHHA